MKAFRYIFYALVKLFIRVFYGLKGYSCVRYKPKSKNYLVLYNHTTVWDHFLTALILPGHMDFVASEHIFRKGWLSRLLVFAVDPIARPKGASAAGTTREMLRRLANGRNVCISAEGNRSFSGETNYIPPTIAKLAKKCGAGLINVRLHGGYFVNPRWSLIRRRGKTWGEVAAEYTPEQLAEMSVDDIYKHICEDLYVNAYKDQEDHYYRYRCKAPAETLETALYACPHCHSIATLKSSGSSLKCSVCGKEYHFNEYGYFDGDGDPFETVLQWYKWQYGCLKDHILGREWEGPLFSVEGRRLSTIAQNQGTVPLGEGRLFMYPDRLELDCGDETFKFPVERVRSMAVSLMNTLLLTMDDGVYYELKSPEKATSALVFLLSYGILTNQENLI